MGLFPISNAGDISPILALTNAGRIFKSIKVVLARMLPKKGGQYAMSKRTYPVLLLGR